MSKPFSSQENLPAVAGGQPVFGKTLNIIRPSLCDPQTILPELKDIFSSGTITTSKYVRELEKTCAFYLGVRHVVAVASATNALMLAVKGLGLTGEVIVPSFTFTATVHSLIWNNIKPVFVDCEQGTCNIDPAKIREKITPATSAILPVYIFGNPPRIDELEQIAQENQIKLIFDSAQAFGAKYQGTRAGGFGDCEIFSLSPTKVITACEGGIVATNDDNLAALIKKLRDYGKSFVEDDVDMIGLSARMSEVHALIGLTNLKEVDQCIAKRRFLIGLYQSLLKDVPGVGFQKVLPGNEISGNYMVVFIDEDAFGMSRNALVEALRCENIQTKKYFYPLVHKQKAYLSLGLSESADLPVSEQAAEQGLALPLYGDMTEQDVEKVCFAVKRIRDYSHLKEVAGSASGGQELS